VMKRSALGARERLRVSNGFADWMPKKARVLPLNRSDIVVNFH
jgi:hypothetical protein